MALYLGKDKIAGNSVDSRIGDTLPVGTIVEYDGTEVPVNWELVEDATPVIIYDTDDAETVYNKVNNSIEIEYGEDGSLTGINYIRPLFFRDKVCSKLLEGNLIWPSSTDNKTINKWEMGFNTFLCYGLLGGNSFYSRIVKVEYINSEYNLTIGEASYSDIVPIQDNLDSEIGDEALSANQGYILNNLITELTARVAALEELHKLPTFTYEGYSGTQTFEFEEGMTWSEFVNSEYNTDSKFYLEDTSDSNSYICETGVSKTARVMLDSDYIDASTVIVANAEYYYSQDPI